MNVLPIRRPLGCLKTVLRQTRHVRQIQRTFASEASSQQPPTSSTPSTTSQFRLHKPKTHKPTPFAARPDRAKVGDVLMVTTHRGEPFAGALIQIRRRGVDTAIQLRGNLMNTGVEMRPKRARRARLTYLRKKKHDMGSVDHLVWAWKRERSQLRSSNRGKHLGTVFESQ
ncbi:unnamed protein product [Parascedosporium putredinis]|uniref:Ribosomal protein L19 n=1 Tax=Parascedosporium putredinis TaxID=1442378 RepID=A0A9P1H9W4_9PEZI|nr:unnamed protein product [Parascedosporium putredinis]CAI8000674.1 unnamed protein product [Parascedosporium putredinis]